MRFFGTTILSSAHRRPYLKCCRFSSLRSRVVGLKKVGEDLGALAVVFHPVVENGVGWGDEAANDIGDREHGSIEFFRLSFIVHPAQDVRNNVRLPGNVVNGKIELLKSVQPSDLAGGAVLPWFGCTSALNCRCRR